MDRILEIAKLLMRNNQVYFTLIANELSKYGITIPQAVVLDTIKDQRRTIGEISKAIDLSYSTVSGIVDRLERHRLVVRERDEIDRRVVWVSITDQFGCLGKDHPILIEDLYSHIFLDDFKELSSEQLDSLYSSLQLINHLVEKKAKVIQEKKGSEVV